MRALGSGPELTTELSRPFVLFAAGQEDLRRGVSLCHGLTGFRLFDNARRITSDSLVDGSWVMIDLSSNSAACRCVLAAQNHLTCFPGDIASPEGGESSQAETMGAGDSWWRAI